MNPHAGSGVRPPFTPSQWQELEHQALIFKYMMAGMPVPPDLLLPIRASIESSRFFHHPSMGYCSFNGKKADPEPGRCRRTDGKKWRCSKDAHPDSKYCERHMHRGRNRSRKPVESPTGSQPSSSTVASLTVAAASGPGTANPCNFETLPLHSSVSGHPGSQTSQLLVDTSDYGMSSKDYRYLHGIKSDVDEHSFFSEAAGSARGLGMDSASESTWRLMPSRVSSFPSTKQRSSSSIWQGSSYSQMQGLQDIEPASLASAIPKQQQHCFFGNEIGGGSDPVKQEGQSLRPFFDEWPKTRDSWSDLEEERSNRSSFSTTQLSISIPMASSDFSATSSRSPNDD